MLRGCTWVSAGNLQGPGERLIRILMRITELGEREEKTTLRTEQDTYFHL